MKKKQYRRTHATFFEYPDEFEESEAALSPGERKERRKIKERFVVEQFNASQKRFTNVTNCGEDPPDCEALDADGRRVGIEVTELVHEKSAAGVPPKALHPKALARGWKPDDLTKAIDRLLKKKGAGQLKGGSYASYIVIMHTDELMLHHDLVRSVLENHRFNRPKLIEEAFVMLSYQPNFGYFVVPVRFL